MVEQQSEVRPAEYVDGTWIHFMLKELRAKTKVYVIANKDDGSVLGEVKWFGRWRKYAAALNGMFEEKCMREIADFCEKLTREHKQEKAGK